MIQIHDEIFIFAFCRTVNARGSISFCPQPEAMVRVPLLNLYLSPFENMATFDLIIVIMIVMITIVLFAHYYHPTSGVMSNSQY